MNNVYLPNGRAIPAWLRAFPLAALLACCWLLPGKAMAANDCWIGGTSIAFGSVGGGGGTTSNSVTFEGVRNFV